MKLKLAACALLLGLVASVVWSSSRHGQRIASPGSQVPETSSPALAVSPPAMPQAASRALAPLAPMDLARVPARIRAVVDPQQEFWSRMSVVHTLGKELGQVEVESLLQFLRLPDDGSQLVLKNDLLNVLRDQVQPAPGLAATLADIIQNPAQAPAMRAYALQHLSVWWRKVGATQSAVVASAAEQAQTSRIFWDALDASDPTVSGTALLCLHRLSLEDAAFEPKRLSAWALRAVGDERVPAATRGTLLQVCAERNLAPALPVALDLSHRASTVPLQIAAIRALGELGGRDQLAFLAELAAGANERLQPSARAALVCLRGRINP